MSSSSMHGLFLTVALFIAVLTAAHAKPSHPFALHNFPDHIDALPPLFPAAHFHSIAPPPPPPAAFLPPPAPLPLAQPLPLPLAAAAPAPVFAPAPIPVFEPAPAPVFHAPATVFHAPAPLPAPLLPAPLPAPVFTAAPALPLTKVLPPVLEAVPFALHAPTYRAIPGPKTTTHHISVGYAFPAPPVAKFVAAAPLTLGHHHHHHSLW